MIQIHKVADLEVAIQLGTLIPSDAKPRSRHRFWVKDRRLDAFLSTDGRIIHLHWVERAQKAGPVRQCQHPYPDGFNSGQIHLKVPAYSWFTFRDGSYGREFKMSQLAAAEGADV